MTMITAAWTAARRFVRNPRGWTTVYDIENECHLETRTGTEVVEFWIALQRDRFGFRRMWIPDLPGLKPSRLHGLALAQRWVADGKPITP